MTMSPSGEVKPSVLLHGCGRALLTASPTGTPMATDRWLIDLLSEALTALVCIGHVAAVAADARAHNADRHNAETGEAITSETGEAMATGAVAAVGLSEGELGATSVSTSSGAKSTSSSGWKFRLVCPENMKMRVGTSFRRFWRQSGVPSL